MKTRAPLSGRFNPDTHWLGFWVPQWRKEKSLPMHSVELRPFIPKPVVSLGNLGSLPEIIIRDRLKAYMFRNDQIFTHAAHKIGIIYSKLPCFV